MLVNRWDLSDDAESAIVQSKVFETPETVVAIPESGVKLVQPVSEAGSL